MKLGVVLVTFNRLNLLKKSLQLYADQTRKPDYILVVNNASTDGTTEYLHEWETKISEFKRIVIQLEKNLGGSGGFHAGLKKSLDLDADWIWIADDDAFPGKKCFEILEQYTKKMEHTDTVAICSKIMSGDHIATGHRCRYGSKLLGCLLRPVPEQEYAKEYFQVDMFSYVGTAIKKEALKEGGLPRADFFIYGDDYEHAIRVGKCGTMICVPSMVVDHTTNNSNCMELSWRDYYETRNNTWIQKRYFGKYAFFLRCAMRMGTAYRSRNRLKIKVFKEAIQDAKHDRLGIHEVYKPGWIPKQ